MSSETVTVRILDKDYQVACPPSERSALLESAQLLDERMRGIKGAGSVVGLERIAVMAALNLSHELLKAKNSASRKTASKAELQRLHDKIDRAFKILESAR